MHSLKVLSVLAVCVICIQSARYRGGVEDRSYSSAAISRNTYNTGAYIPEYENPRRPYNFDYHVRDEVGNAHYRQETSDTSGVVRGTYGYTDNQGLYRVVEYVADAGGFRANVRSNEPGVGKQSPADVVLIAFDPPADIQNRYTRFGTTYGSPQSVTIGGGRAGAGAGSYGGTSRTAQGQQGYGGYPIEVRLSERSRSDACNFIVGSFGQGC